MKLHSVEENLFREYGRIVEGYSINAFIEKLKEKECPEDKKIYIASDPELENSLLKSELSDNFFGGMPIQIGYCNGHNTHLNALEYHKSSEISITAQDTIFMFAHRSDLNNDFVIATTKVKAFFIPQNVVIEIFSNTLHFSPCQIDGNGFRVAVALPKGTNQPLTKKPRYHNKEDNLLLAINKWVVGHPEGNCKPGTFIGLIGKNPSIFDINF